MQAGGEAELLLGEAADPAQLAHGDAERIAEPVRLVWRKEALRGVRTASVV